MPSLQGFMSACRFPSNDSNSHTTAQSDITTSPANIYGKLSFPHRRSANENAMPAKGKGRNCPAAPPKAPACGRDYARNVREALGEEYARNVRG